MANDPTMEEILAAMQELTGQASSGGGSLEKYREILPILFKEGDIAIEMFDEVIEKFGPKLGEYLDKLSEFHVNSRIKTFKAYIGAGMSESSAVALITSDAHNQMMVMKSLQK